jgi:hypothetical protein
MNKLVDFLIGKNIKLPLAFVIVYGGAIALMFTIVALTPEIPIVDDLTLQFFVAMTLLLIWAFFVIKGGSVKPPKAK